jgi:hypothetical protein
MKPRHTSHLAAGSAALAAALATAILAPVAQAAPLSGGGGGGGGSSSNGPCSITTDTWAIQGEGQQGQIRVRAEVFVGTPSATWKWTLSDNGERVGKGTGITNQAHHEHWYFQARAAFPGKAGADQIAFHAKKPGTDETCDGTLTL